MLLCLLTLHIVCQTQIAAAAFVVPTRSCAVVQNKHLGRGGSIANGNHNCRQDAFAATFAPSRLCRFAKSGSGDDDEMRKEAGMAEAFRQLDELQSLDDGDDATNKENEGASADSSFDKDAAVAAAAEASVSKDTLFTGAEPMPMEQEVKIYSEMVSELEDTDQADLYKDVLSELGGSSGDSSSAELTQEQPPSPSIPPMIESESDTEAFMEQALEEALEEVKVNNPKVTGSILDDKEIMAEIEQIFERGNEKLVESLDEIRREQVRIIRIHWSNWIVEGRRHRYNGRCCSIQPAITRSFHCFCFFWRSPRWPHRAPPPRQTSRWRNSRTTKSDWPRPKNPWQA